MVKTMLGALQSVGCPIDLKRHVLCDICTPGSDVMINHGGYDRENNQIFICANNANSKGKVHAVLVQNLVHMFDRCVSKVDYGNPDHLACTEIRKFNLASCALITNLKRSDATFAVKGEHPNCVRNSAVESLVKTQYLDQATAEAAVDRVFDRCYRDMEPYGRRSKSPKDFDLMANERYLFGYY